MAESSILIICNGLSRYYKLHNRPYDKILATYCDDNDIDDEQFVQELDEEPSESLIIEFAKEGGNDFKFPFGKSQPSSEEEQAEFIMKIIKQIHEDPNVDFDLDPTTYDKDYFNIDEKDLGEIKDIYKKQCPAIFYQGLSTDKGFLQILAITKKHKDDYVLHLVDNFARYRVKNIKNTKYGETEWVAECPHFKITKEIENPLRIKNNKSKSNSEYLGDVIKAAVSSFHLRCCSKLNFNSFKVINDSLEDIVFYIDGAVRFIKHIITDATKLKQVVCPFQIDFAIASGEPEVQKAKDEKDEDQDEKDESGHNDDDDDPRGAFVDYVGDIKGKLDQNNMKYASAKCNPQQMDRKSFRVFRDSLNELRGNDIKNFEIVHKKRLITFIDRRESKKNVEKSDDIYMFKCPYKSTNTYTNEMPNDCVSLWGMSASKTCILPNINYNEKKAIGEPNSANVDEKKEDEDKKKDKKIGAGDHCKYGLLSFSFIVKSENVIKIYVYFGGEMLRFMPDDIKIVLPKIFNMEYEGNEEYIEDKSGDLDKLINEMNKNVEDVEFRKFQNNIKN